MAPNPNNNRWVLMKFCIYKLRMLVSDEQYRPKYIQSADIIFENFYGIKHFTRKLSDCCTDIEFSRNIDRIGMNQLLQLLKNSRYYNALRDLVIAGDELAKIKHKIRKQKMKGTVDKSLIKEYRYLSKIYDRGQNILRKMLGLKSYKKAYKRKFSAVKNLMNEHGGGWSDGWSDYAFSAFGPSADYYDDDPYDNDDDDGYRYEDASELQDFLKMMNGTTNYMGGAPRRPSPQRRDSSGIDYDDPYDDEWGDYQIGVPFGEAQSEEGESEIEHRINSLYSKLSAIEDIVDAYATQATYDKVHHRNPITHKPLTMEQQRPMEYNPETFQSQTQEQNASNMAMQAQLSQVIGIVGNLTKAMSNFEDWRSSIEAALDEEDDDEYIPGSGVDVRMGPPAFTDQEPVSPAQQLYDQVTNRHPDPYQSTPIPEQDPTTMDREELIDEINSAPPRTVIAEKVPSQN